MCTCSFSVLKLNLLNNLQASSCSCDVEGHRRAVLLLLSTAVPAIVTIGVAGTTNPAADFAADVAFAVVCQAITQLFVCGLEVDVLVSLSGEQLAQ